MKKSAAESNQSDKVNIPQLATVPASPIRQPLGTVAPLKGEILPPKKDEDYEVTRTAKKRAMRRKAQEYAEKAVEVLAENLKHPDPEIRAKAANDMLKWGGFAAPDLDGVNPEGLQIAIIRFGEQA